MHSPILTIARKEHHRCYRDRFLQTVTAFLVVAVVVSIVAGAIALASDVATYAAARDQLLALGKPASAIAAPEFYHTLKLLRGAIEQIEIMGAVIALLGGVTAPPPPNGGRQTLALILTRPLQHWQFLAAKLMGGIGLAALSLLAVFLSRPRFCWQYLRGLACRATIWRASRSPGLLPRSMWRGFSPCPSGFAFGPANLPMATLYGFAIWLLIVLIAPQIGDTLVPTIRSQVGYSRSSRCQKAEQDRIKAGYAGYEALRNGIEVASVTKHFERFSFAVLGIKDTYNGTPLAASSPKKRGDALGFCCSPSGWAGLSCSVDFPRPPDQGIVPMKTTTSLALILSLVGTMSLAAGPVTDGDGVPDTAEPLLHTDPGNPDTDGDGQNDLARGPRHRSRPDRFRRCRRAVPYRRALVRRITSIPRQGRFSRPFGTILVKLHCDRRDRPHRFLHDS